MAKPRIFVSSTYYDLRHIRSSLEAFVDSFGYEAVLFESGDIPFQPDLPIDESCYAEIKNCHVLILVIGGRYGSPATDESEVNKKLEEDHYKFYNSVTKKEYESARDRQIPMFIFVEKGVLAEFQTFRQNKDNTSIHYAHVQNINVFRLLDEIIAQPKNNFVRGFENFDDISGWLRDQWAGLFADFLAKRQSEATIKSLASQISELNSVVEALKEYNESLVKQMVPESARLISTQRKRIQHDQLRRFNREPLISYLRRTFGAKWVPSKIYTAFGKAKSIEGFLKKAGVGVSEMHDFLEKHASAANRDFVEIKERYFPAEPEGEEEKD